MSVAAAPDPGRALLRWLHAVDIPDTAVLACSHTVVPSIPVGAVGIRVQGCLASMTLALPAQLLACGVSRIEVCGCEQQPDAVGARLANWQEAFSVVVPAAASTPRRRRPRRQRGGPMFDMSRPSVSRRSLFGVQPRWETPFDVSGDEAARGVAALEVLQSDGRVRVDLGTPAQTDRVSITMQAEGCTACGVCVRACPHDALEMIETDGTSVLGHHEDVCRADQQCIQLCPETALSVTGQLQLTDLLKRVPVELARIETRACARCRARHPATDGALCATCAFRTANPFGSRTPPGLRD